MFCINCFYPTTQVKNSRKKKKEPMVWRRRYCPGCDMIFTTHERPSLADNAKVHKAAQKTETFNIGRLTLSIARAFAHSPEGAKLYAFPLAETVENALSTQVKVITPEEITTITHTTLKRFDELVALQYAAQHQLITSVRRRGRPSTAWRE